METPGEKDEEKTSADKAQDEAEKEPEAWVRIDRLDEAPSTTLIVLGGFLQQKEAKKLLTKVNSLRNEDVKHVIFDMSEVKYANSSAIAAFASCANLLKGHGGQTVLLGLRPNIRLVFATLGLLGLFIIAATKEEAVKALS